jgi:hypothetical protein
MNQIHLKKNGTLVYNQQATENDPLTYLGFKVEIEDGCSLRSFFQMLDRYDLLTRLNPFLEAYMAQFHSCAPNGCHTKEIDSIELGKTIEMIGFPGDPRVETYVSLGGRRDGEVVDIQALWLDSLLDVEVRLGKLTHVVFGDAIDTFEYDTVFNLFEFIDGIAWQLSFHNMPRECRISF